jgi:hypothetical protein
MKRLYIILYHCIYWIYRIVHILTFNHYFYHESWYKGSYVVQLVLIPFFYTNYGILIPALLEKKYKKFIFLNIVWATSFVWVYSRWTIYQRNLLYNESLIPPDYIETSNNVIYIWLISSCFCMFEYWIKNLKNIESLAVESKSHILKSEENKMLNDLLSDYLTALEKKSTQELPDKILLVSDFFKYVLYHSNKTESLRTELKYLEIYAELKNSSQHSVSIQVDVKNDSKLIASSSIVVLVNQIVNTFFKDKPVEVFINEGPDDIIISLPVSNNESTIYELISNEFVTSTFVVQNGNLIFSIKAIAATETESKTISKF